MSTHRILLGSESQYRPEQMYRIDDSRWDNSLKVKVIQEDTPVPSPLNIVRSGNKRYDISPTNVQHHGTSDIVASSLQAAFDDMLRPPARGITACARSASLQKPLPSLPRSVSVPITRELPAELPGSLLLANQGYPLDQSTPITGTVWPASHSPLVENHAATHPRKKHSPSVEVPEPITHHKSAPDLSARHGTMTSARGWPTPTLFDRRHAKWLSESSTPICSRPAPALVKTSSSTELKHSFTTSGDKAAGGSNISPLAVGLDQLPLSNVAGKVQKTTSEEFRSRQQDDLSGCVTPAAIITRSKGIAKPESAIESRDHEILILQAQYGDQRTPCQAHAASLADCHSEEVAPQRPHASGREEAQSPCLQHTSGGNFIPLSDNPELLQTPIREIDTTGSVSSVSTPPEKSTPEKQRSSRHLRDSTEMENLKRKLSGSRRPEAASRNLLPELNQYKQNNVAMQRQIESLMAKLNESKKKERDSQVAREQAEYERIEWQTKAVEASGFTKSVQSMQNTIDHLESRLEQANTERLDAEEQLHSLQAGRSPFHAVLNKLERRVVTDPGMAIAYKGLHENISTDSNSPQENDSSDFQTSSRLITNIEQLRSQITQKDAHITELEGERDDLRREHEQLKVERDEVTLRSDIQADLLHKTQQSDTYIEQLRTAVFNREAIIADKEKSLRVVERQLSLHKLLLHAEIRRHATMKLNGAVEDEALPVLTTLAKQEDIDRWMSSLNRRLQKDRSLRKNDDCISGHENELKCLRQEIEFYVREIIYYKLDIRGYKSDIRKLKRATSQMSTHGSRISDLDSESSSTRPAPTPIRSHFAPATSEPDPSTTASPIGVGSTPKSPLSGRPITPIMTHIGLDTVFTPPNSQKRTDQHQQQLLDLGILAFNKNPESTVNVRHTNEAADNDTSVFMTDLVIELSENGNPESSLLDQDATAGIPADLLLRTRCNFRQQDGRSCIQESLSETGAIASTPKRSKSLQCARDDLSDGKATSYRKRSASESDVGSSPVGLIHPRIGLSGCSLGSSELSSVLAQKSQFNTLAGQSPEKDLGASSASGDKVMGRRYHRPEPIPLVGPEATTSEMDKFITQAPNSTERYLNAVSDTGTPYAIRRGSPYKATLITPNTDFRPTPCSITRNAPLKVHTSVARSAFNSTMASTPVTSPISLSGTPDCISPLKTAPVQSVRSIFAIPSREINSSRSKQDDSMGQREPRTPTHSRTVSGSSILTAIRMPKLRNKENQELRVVKKNSIGSPKALGSPFRLE